MKKYLVLTSVLALAACGGGSGGDSQVLSAQDSNARVTGMNSFVIIGGDNPTVNPNVARSSILQPDGGIWYDLENVTFKSIPTSGVIADLKFHTDENGKIVSMEFPDAESIMAGHDSVSVMVGEMKRRGDTNVFISRPGQIPNMDQTGEMTLEYQSYAKQAGQGLTYSDFGLLKVDTSVLVGADEDTVYIPFMGGYDPKNVDNDRMKVLAQSDDVVFSGLAKGSVSYSNLANNTGFSEKLEDDDATLTFAQDGKQTLAADFTNWAKIEAVKAADGTNQFKVIGEPYVDSTSKLYLTTSPAGLEDHDKKEDPMVAVYMMAMQTGYYGDNNAPNEGVGLVQYQQMTGYNAGINDYEHHVNVDLGFGGTVQNSAH